MAHLPLDEESIQRPESPYGITKMVAEHYLRYWQEVHGLNYTALRYGNVYGPRQDPNGEAGVISIFAKRFLAHEGVRIDWDGEQCKDYVYVGDVARANVLALTGGDNNFICIGTGQPISVNEIHKTLARITGFEAPITKAPKRPGDIYLSYFNHSKAERILGWKPEVTFEEGEKGQAHCPGPKHEKKQHGPKAPRHLQKRDRLKQEQQAKRLLTRQKREERKQEQEEHRQRKQQEREERKREQEHKRERRLRAREEREQDVCDAERGMNRSSASENDAWHASKNAWRASPAAATSSALSTIFADSQPLGALPKPP